MFSALIVHARPEPALTLTLSRLVEAALAGLLADVAIADFCDDPLAARLAEEGGCALKRLAGDPTQALARMIGEALDAVIKDAERWEYAYRHDVDLGIHSDCYVDDLISCEKRLRQ